MLSNLQISSDLVIPQLYEISIIIISNLKIRKLKLVRVTFQNYAVRMEQLGRLPGHAVWAIGHTVSCA